jgi:hypothetical protein
LVPAISSLKRAKELQQVLFLHWRQLGAEDQTEKLDRTKWLVGFSIVVIVVTIIIVKYGVAHRLLIM